MYPKLADPLPWLGGPGGTAWPQGPRCRASWATSLPSASAPVPPRVGVARPPRAAPPLCPRPCHASLALHKSGHCGQYWWVVSPRLWCLAGLGGAKLWQVRAHQGTCPRCRLCSNLAEVWECMPWHRESNPGDCPQLLQAPGGAQPGATLQRLAPLITVF